MFVLSGLHIGTQCVKDLSVKILYNCLPCNGAARNQDHPTNACLVWRGYFTAYYLGTMSTWISVYGLLINWGKKANTESLYCFTTACLWAAFLWLTGLADHLMTWQSSAYTKADWSHLFLNSERSLETKVLLSPWQMRQHSQGYWTIKLSPIILQIYMMIWTDDSTYLTDLETVPKWSYRSS